MIIGMSVYKVWPKKSITSKNLIYQNMIKRTGVREWEMMKKMVNLPEDDKEDGIEGLEDDEEECKST